MCILTSGRCRRRRRRRRETFGSRAGRTCAVRGRRLQTAATAAWPAGVPAPPSLPTTTRPGDDHTGRRAARRQFQSTVDDVFAFGLLKYYNNNIL